jgi:hypothetical protein
MPANEELAAKCTAPANWLPGTGNACAGANGQCSGGAVNDGVSESSRARCSALMLQWCLPWRRQQAGRLASLVGDSASRDEANGRPKTTSNAMESSLRNAVIQAGLRCGCNGRSSIIAPAGIGPAGSAPSGSAFAANQRGSAVEALPRLQCLKCLRDDVEAHRACRTADSLGSSFDRGRVHVRHLGRGDLHDLLLGDLADLLGIGLA